MVIPSDPPYFNDPLPDPHWMTVDDEHAKTVCKVGQGAACCRYLTMGGDGWSCEKLTGLRRAIDNRVRLGKFTAISDNCEGRRSR